MITWGQQGSAIDIVTAKLMVGDIDKPSNG